MVPGSDSETHLGWRWRRRRRVLNLKNLQLISAFCVCVLSTLLCSGASADSQVKRVHFIVEPENSVVVRDQPARLDCQVSDESANISWKRDDILLTFRGDSRRKQLSNGSLIFSSIRHTRSEWPDEGYFQCLATVPSVGTLLSRKAKLQVASLLRFDEEPSDKDVLLGEKALFVCSIQATPSPTILWLKNGQPLTLDASRMLLLPSGSLEIDGVTKSDEGRYQCNATNIANSRLSREAALQVITDPDLLNAPRQPEFISKPKSTVAIEGQNVTLDCVANGSPAPWITWLKDGTSLDMANLDSRFVKLGSGSLLIIHVQEADSGTYQCRAYNKEDSIDASALLDVQVAPRFEKKPTSQIAKEKQDIELECEVYGRPEPTVEWYKNGELIIESDYFQMVNGKHLKILGLVSSDAGIYQCMAFNAAGYIQASAHLSVLPASGSSPSHEEVEISDLPDLDLQTHLHLGDDWGVQGLPSDPRNVSSVIVSKRFVTLRWQPPLHSEGPVLTYSVFYHQDSSNRERIVNTSKEETIIQGLQPGKAYTFQVVAHGPQGPGIPSKPIVIMTQGEDSIPTGPRNLRAFPVSNSAIQVQWDAPSNDHGTLPLPLTYNVYYMQEGSSEESHIATQGTSYVIHNLHPYTEYSIWVAPEGGRSTEDVSARTHSDIPSDTPQNVTVEAASSTSIVVHWEPPPPEHQNGVITGYKIRYKERGRRGETITTDGNRRLYAITNLEKGQEYSLRISALTVNGSGPWTDWIDVETYPMDLDESVVPDAPGSIRARPMKTSITVMWTPPKNQSIIVRGYTIGYGIGVPDVYKKLVDGKQRYYAIEGLEPNAEYVISLRAYNGMGDGRPIYEHVRTRGDDDTESASPITPPLGVKAIVHSENTVVLYWTDSTLPSDQVTDNRYYTIRYTSHPQSPRYKFRNTTELNYMIDDLKPYTRYEFSVKVTKGLRESQWSLVAVNTTDEAAPESPPRDLTIVPSDNNPDMVYVNWQPPKIPNGIITGYVIYYTTNLSQPDWNWLVDGVVGDRLTTTVRGLKPGLSYYFKIQARNSKGNSPPSPTAIYHTPSFSHAGIPGGSTGESDGGNQDFPMVYVIVTCVGGVIFLILLAGGTYLLCRRRQDHRQRMRQGYMKPGGKGKGDLKPPDLWIHHQEHVEMRCVDGGQSDDELNVQAQSHRPGTSTPVQKQYLSNSTLDRRSVSGFGGSSTYLSSKGDIRRGESPEKAFATGRRPPVKPKPSIMIPVDAQPPKEPLAIVNGEVLVGPPRPPSYPRTQFHMTRTAAHVTVDPSGAPVMHTSPTVEHPYSVVATTASITMTTGPFDSEEDRSGLKSFHPQYPYPLSSGKPHSNPPTHSQSQPHSPTGEMLPKVTTPLRRVHSPPHPLANPRVLSTASSADLKPTLSTEELSQEMANLEGLMKDLNAITASQFE